MPRPKQTGHNHVVLTAAEKSLHMQGSQGCWDTGPRLALPL